ncbi:MAG: hypothetical protein AAGC46_13405 [Solirubrobacteraceae bacterium]|nr:hypothetical protein [Patulibacter sp.]
MSSPHAHTRRVLPGCARARARFAAVLVVTVCSATGLSACRTIGPAADEAKAKQDGVATAKAPAPQTTPALSAEAQRDAAALAVPDPDTTPATSTTPAAPGSTPAAGGATTPAADATTPGGADATSPGAAADAPASTPPQPPKVVVDKPWVIIGRPFLVDLTAPRGTSSGKTGYQLVFRTRGDFRGVRAGTPLGDERHYKVGLIDVPELPAYVPGGQANMRLGDRNKSKGRYCWLATLGKRGTDSPIVFPARADGIAMAITFDLHGAPVQHRTAPVFVRTRSGEQPSELQNALGCHLNYF